MDLAVICLLPTDLSLSTDNYEMHTAASLGKKRVLAIVTAASGCAQAAIIQSSWWTPVRPLAVYHNVISLHSMFVISIPTELNCRGFIMRDKVPWACTGASARGLVCALWSLNIPSRARTLRSFRFTEPHTSKTIGSSAASLICAAVDSHQRCIPTQSYSLDITPSASPRLRCPRPTTRSPRPFASPSPLRHTPGILRYLLMPARKTNPSHFPPHALSRLPCIESIAGGVSHRLLSASYQSLTFFTGFVFRTTRVHTVAGGPRPIAVPARNGGEDEKEEAAPSSVRFWVGPAHKRACPAIVATTLLRKLIGAVSSEAAEFNTSQIEYWN
ncbi:hypothetical protein DFH06DRAFT_1319502 [Mycena polygramma]|nr:hypothetical protein DFH06DRAFT_1319502 [Mycena polygramma]